MLVSNEPINKIRGRLRTGGFWQRAQAFSDYFAKSSPVSTDQAQLYHQGLRKLQTTIDARSHSQFRNILKSLRPFLKR